MKKAVFAKKALSLILVLSVLFSFAGCDNSVETPPTDNIVASTGTETRPSEMTDQAEVFVKPENYAAALMITINPQLCLYLDAAGNVLALEAANKDAQEIVDSICFENAGFEAAIEIIVTTSQKKGYLKGDAVIRVEVTEAKDPAVDIADILDKATTTVSQTAAKLDIYVEVKTEDKSSIDTKPTEAPTEPDAPPETTAPSTPTETVPAQCSHTYNATTCTAPKTCSKCGVTEGSASGHNWNEATCNTPKTCKTCNATEGNAAGHTITSICERCGVKNSNYKAIMGKTWEITTHKTSGEISKIVVTFQSDYTVAHHVKWYRPIEKIAEEKGTDVDIIRQQAADGQFAYYDIIDEKEYIGEPAVIDAKISYRDSEDCVILTFAWLPNNTTSTCRLERSDFSEFVATSSDTDSIPVGSKMVCVKCDATEGETHEHIYQNGVCSCGTRQLGVGTWSRVRQDGDRLYVLSINFLTGSGTGGVSSKSYQKVSSLESGTPTHITYEGEGYYCLTGAGDPCYYEVGENTVTVHLGEVGGNGTEVITLQRVGTDQVMVIEITSFYGLQKGDVLTYQLVD